MNVWSAINELEQLRREMDRLFAYPGAGNGNGHNRLAFLPGTGARQYPLVNLYEDENGYFVSALAPGIDAENIRVSIVGHVLSLSGEKTRNDEGVKPESYHRNERATGKFVRSVELPNEVDVDKVEAEYKDGILNITLPKSEKARPRSIAVKTN